VRARFGRFVNIAFIGCLACSSITTHAQQRTAAEQFLFDAVNASRAAAGLPILTWNESLTRAAASHAELMRKEDSLSHQFEQEPDLPERVSANGIRFTVIAENVGLGDSAVNLHSSFMNSPDHRDNILDHDVNTIGISVREARGELWAVEDFARTVVELSYEEQEHQVASLLKAAGLKKVGATVSARDTCRKTTGFAGEQPAFLLRYTSADLTQLPQQLMARLAKGGIGEAAVGACQGRTTKEFSSYSIAIILYR
jgi:hypothetical protein